MTAKRTLATSMALLAFGVAGCGGDAENGGAEASATGSKVDIQDFKFAPKSVKVKVGDAVTFANADKAKHNAQTDDGAAAAFDTGDLLEGDTKAVSFDEAGSYAYYCVYHRFMTGTVEVSE